MRSMSGAVGEEHLEYFHATTEIFSSVLLSLSLVSLYLSLSSLCLGPLDGVRCIKTRMRCPLFSFCSVCVRRADAAVAQARENDEVT